MVEVDVSAALRDLTGGMEITEFNQSVRETCVVGDIFGRGTTIRMREVDRYDVQLRWQQAETQKVRAVRSQITYPLKPPGNSEFPPHFDMALFAVQCVGAKEWKVFTNHTDLPVRKTDWNPQAFGTDHEPLHLTIKIEPLKAVDLPAKALHPKSGADRVLPPLE
jgi:hypothetical protein